MVFKKHKMNNWVKKKQKDSFFKKNFILFLNMDIFMQTYLCVYYIEIYVNIYIIYICIYLSIIYLYREKKKLFSAKDIHSRMSPDQGISFLCFSLILLQ